MVDLEEELGDLLKAQKLTLATAESCTGGLIANMITNIPGSSQYFERGVISYSNQSKIELLNVPENTLINHGAVSSDTAVAMAEGIRSVAKTDLGLGVTGIAGPTGGTTEKPVGLVYIALASEINVKHFKFNFQGTRLEIKQQTAIKALEILIEHLKK
jgi:nicotinamide-nucleotide amidase